MLGRVTIVTFIILLSVAAWAQAQGFECAALKPSASSLPSYASIPGQARCEGFFERSVSQPFIELVSLTRGQPPAADSATQVPALNLYADASTPLRLVVQPQPSRPFYRVDAAMQSGQILLWNPAQMLTATRLPLSELGFLALVASPSSSAGSLPTIAPVAFTEKGRKDTRAYAVVRVSVEVSSVAWRSYRVGADTASLPASGWTDLPDSHLYAWRRITLPIDLPSDGKELRVDVQAVGASNSQTLPLLRFSIVGSRDANPAN